MQPIIIPRSDHPISRKNIDADALKVLYRLYRSGHTAFLVGGGVRDLLIGRNPKDFDISTSARPGQVKKLFRNCWLIGRRFRLAHIHFRDHKIVEVSTFRAQPERDEENQEDLLVRQDNTFGSPEEDALRRDFTINGLFYDIASFSLIDYVGGVDDIEAGVIRTIGDPNVRFREDPVRMLRAIKFAARLDFAIEPETWEAICEHAEEITRCSTSRVVEEAARLLEGGASCRSLQLMKASGLLGYVLPEVYEYLHGVPAGPGLQLDARSEARQSSEAIEAEMLLDADEDVDPEEQERVLGVDEQPIDSEEAEDEAAGDEQAGEGGVEALEPSDDVPLSEEEDLDLVADERSMEIVTPEGTRCALAPDRGALFWRLLSSVDARTRAGFPLTRATLYSALFHPIVRHTADWVLAEQPDRDPEQLVLALLRPLTETVLVSKRDRERVCQILAAQRKFRRANRGFAQVLSRKPYFAEALDLFEITVFATGDGVDVLGWWRERHPYVAPVATSAGRAKPALAGEGRDEGPARRSRRRRRGGRGEVEREVDVEAPERSSGGRDRHREGRGEYGGESGYARQADDDTRRRGSRSRDRVPERRDDERSSSRWRRDEEDRGRGRSGGGGGDTRNRDDERPVYRRRDARDLERVNASDYGITDEGRGGSRSGRSSRGRSTSSSERSPRRTPFREEGYRGPRGGAFDVEYYESRVGRDLTTDSPPPRRDERSRGNGNRRRRRKPPTSGH